MNIKKQVNRMIKTGDWTINDLVTYLVKVQSTLSGEELQKLKVTAAFVKENKDKTNESSDREGQKPVPRVPRYKASDLYEPIDALRDLKLPVIDWGTEHKWRPSSEEGRLPRYMR
jgi:hypothetical protein